MDLSSPDLVLNQVIEWLNDNLYTRRIGFGEEFMPFTFIWIPKPINHICYYGDLGYATDYYDNFGELKADLEKNVPRLLAFGIFHFDNNISTTIEGVNKEQLYIPEGYLEIPEN